MYRKVKLTLNQNMKLPICPYLILSHSSETETGSTHVVLSVLHSGLPLAPLTPPLPVVMGVSARPSWLRCLRRPPRRPGHRLHQPPRASAPCAAPPPGRWPPLRTASAWTCALPPLDWVLPRDSQVTTMHTTGPRCYFSFVRGMEQNVQQCSAEPF